MNSRAQPESARDDAVAKGKTQRENCARPGIPIHERDVEAYLVKRVKELGGECRKVTWQGRSSAPDRLVMLPRRQSERSLSGVMRAEAFWIELKAPGKAASFPANAHERAQQREHRRMRAMGQRVEVIDSFAGVDEVLR